MVTVPGVFLRGLWLSLALTLVVALAGCDSEGDSAESSASTGLPKTITIGAAIAKSGWLEPYDASISAVEQLVDETNAKGGIDGSKLEVIQVDNRSDPQQAPIAAQQAIEKGADMLLFSSESLTASAGAPVAEENDALNFSLSANEPGFGPPTTGRLSFSAYPSVLSEASADATFLHEKGLERPFLFRDTAIIYGKAYCDGFQQAWERLGGSIVGSVDFKNEDESIASQVNQLKKSNADSVVMCSYPPGGAAAVKQVRDVAIDLPIIAAGSFDGTYWLKGISNTKDIYVATNGSSYDPPNQAAAKLFEKLETRGGRNRRLQRPALGLRRRSADRPGDRRDGQHRRQRARRRAGGKAPPDHHRQDLLHQGLPLRERQLADIRVRERRAEAGHQDHAALRSRIPGLKGLAGTLVPFRHV